ncbi:MAG TPA: hypothetical protein VHZ55_17195, partial [Bryobacteraceae bacterium]|nr:hypothetical protein [Bryobacteraceae bacterium]
KLLTLEYSLPMQADERLKVFVSRSFTPAESSARLDCGTETITPEKSACIRRRRRRTEAGRVLLLLLNGDRACTNQPEMRFTVE